MRRSEANPARRTGSYPPRGIASRASMTIVWPCASTLRCRQFLCRHLAVTVEPCFLRHSSLGLSVTSVSKSIVHFACVDLVCSGLLGLVLCCSIN